MIFVLKLNLIRIFSFGIETLKEISPQLSTSIDDLEISNAFINQSDLNNEKECG